MTSHICLYWKIKEHHLIIEVLRLHTCVCVCQLNFMVFQTKGHHVTHEVSCFKTCSLISQHMVGGRPLNMPNIPRIMILLIARSWFIWYSCIILKIQLRKWSLKIIFIPVLQFVLAYMYIFVLFSGESRISQTRERRPTLVGNLYLGQSENNLAQGQGAGHLLYPSVDPPMLFWNHC